MLCYTSNNQWECVCGGGAGAATIMKFCTKEGYVVGVLGSVLSYGSFEDACDGNLECLRPV